MRLLNTYEELIERDANEISILWKLLQILFYLVNLIAGYVTVHAFYTFQDLFNHNCILWATPKLRSDWQGSGISMTNSTINPWQDRLRIRFRTQRHCSSIQMISILSCICGFVGLSFFSVCGRGGYEVRIYHQPWRLVCPAIVFNFCMALMTLQAACDFEDGFEYFQDSLNRVLHRLGNKPVDEYIQSYNKDGDHLVWKYFRITKISAWTGAAAWTMGLGLLILRVINVTDFRLLKVSVYAPTGRAQEPEKEIRN